MISVVDDENLSANALKRLLTSIGFDVAVFSSARNPQFPEPPDSACLILDLRMQGMNGLELQSVLTRAIAGYPSSFLRLITTTMLAPRRSGAAR